MQSIIKFCHIHRERENQMLFKQRIPFPNHSVVVVVIIGLSEFESNDMHIMRFEKWTNNCLYIVSLIRYAIVYVTYVSNHRAARKQSIGATDKSIYISSSDLKLEHSILVY